MKLFGKRSQPHKRRLEVAGKVALVTGGGDGIGWETARQLHAQGAQVVIVDSNKLAAEKAAKSLGAERALAIAADVTDRQGMQAAVATTLAHFGRLDIVVANAGIAPPAATLRVSDLEDFDRVMAVNVTGVLNTIHPAIDALVEQQGHILVVASAAAFCPPVGGVAYMVSKAAVEQLTRGLKLELAVHGVSVTTAYFGIVDTQLARSTLDGDAIGQAMESRLPGVLRKRIAAQEAGRVLAEAIGERADHVTAPRAWEAYSRLRGLANPLIDRKLLADPGTGELVLKLESRNGG